MIQVYTPSRNIIANGLHASCVHYDDGSEWSIPVLSLVSKYISANASQKVADITLSLGIKTVYKKVKSVLNYIY